MRVLVVILLVACAKPADRAAPVALPKGVEVGDLDRKADACSDFYDYANGAWRAAHPIPQGQPRWSRRAESREANRKQVRDLLAELAAKQWPAGSTEQLAGDQFASCMDEAGVEAAGLQPLQPLLAEIDAATSVQPPIRRLQELGIAAPYGMTGSFDNADPMRYLINFVPGGVGDTDPAHVAKMLQLGGMTEVAARDGAAAVIALEKKLAAVALDAKSAADPVLTEHVMPAAQLREVAPRIDWSAFGEVNVTEPKFLDAVNKELVATPLATWKIYFKWQLLASAAPWLTKAFVAEAGETKPRAERCADLTETLFPEAVGKKYVERYFPPAAKAKARAIANELLEVIEADIPAVAWMSAETKQRALAKISESHVEIGYPDQWRTYAVTIRRDALWANIALARKLAVDDDRRQVGHPTDRRSWKLPPSSPLAYIDLQINELVLPAGFLQAPVFDPAASDAVNFGAMGSGLAHDLMHAIDATGAAYTIDGKPTKWWSATDEVSFRERAACVADEYAAFGEDRVRVLDEAIGDLGGLHLAFTALQKHPGPSIDGFTPAQQFFLAWGQLRGEELTPEARDQMLKGDIHPVPEHRVNGPLVHLPEFQQAFSCKAQPRCAIW